MIFTRGFAVGIAARGLLSSTAIASLTLGAMLVMSTGLALAAGGDGGGNPGSGGGDSATATGGNGVIGLALGQGGGGGGAGATGGAGGDGGGAGAGTGGPAGNPGNDAVGGSNAGGGGGGGGSHGSVGATLPIAPSAGTAGGAGGNGDGTGNGGGGGAGGYGAVVTGSGAFGALGVAVTGSVGGGGGTGAVGGNGGTGGIGLDLTNAAGATFTVNAAVTGGAGGSGGAAGGVAGAGGAGIVGQNLSITMGTGTVAGGGGGGANAIRFLGGTNSLVFTTAASGLTGNVAVTGSLDLGTTAGTTTVANNITGGGSVSKSATGTITLTGTNTYTGATTISGGTLINGGSLASAVTNTATFTNNGTSVGNVTNSGTFNNNLTVTGSLSQSAGTTANAGSISGTLGVTGGTFTDNAGGSVGGTTTNTGGTVTNNGGTFQAVTNTTGTFNNTTGNAGAVSNAATGTNGGTIASLANSGGTFGNSGTATGASTVSGGTVTNTGTFQSTLGVSAGTFNMTAGSVTGTTTNTGGLITNNGGAFGAVTNTTGTFNNTTGNAGAVSNGATATNGGTIASLSNTGGTFNNSGTVSGLLTSSAGSVVNNGALNGGAIINGGTFSGTGSVASLAVNGGTFAPGDAITPGSSMAVAGSLVLQSAVTYLVVINPTTASFTSVTGAATLNGATVSANFANGSYVARHYTIVTAAGGVSGTFGSVANTNLPGGFKSSLSYDTKNAYLDLTLNFTPAATPNFGGGLSGNQQAVGNALINFFNSTGGIPLVFGTLTPAGLTQISGETATGSQQTTFNAMNQFMGVMTDPSVAGRGDPVGGGGTPNAYADEASLAYAARGNSASNSERDAYAAVYTKAPPVATAFAQRWSVWAAGFGGSQSTDGNAVVGSSNAGSSIYGVAVGADYRLSPDTLAGFALAGGGTNFSVANGLGWGRSDLFQAGAFIRHNMGAAYLSGAVAYGWQDITTNRTVAIAGIDQLRAEFNANAWSGRVEGGYRLVSPWLGITPYAAGQFTTFDLPAYAEQALVGSNAFALAYGSKSVTATRSELGLRSDKSFAMADGVFTLRGRAAWAHDFNTDRVIGATFQTLPGASFVVNGAAQAHDAALVTASAEKKWLNGWSAAATFEGEFSNVTRSYAGKGVARYSW
jgi:uncharacterized protein with beta-barrel porin domain